MGNRRFPLPLSPPPLSAVVYITFFVESYGGKRGEIVENAHFSVPFGAEVVGVLDTGPPL